jgi:putative AlgH/UPF0301 family transcriptional regulator
MVTPMATHESNGDRISGSPRFLVASPYLRGTPYDRQVVYVLERSETRVVGLCLNSDFRYSLRDLGANLAEAIRQPRRGAQAIATLPATVMVWAPGQLDRELRQGIWLSGPFEFAWVFGDHDDLWVEMVQSIGRSVLCDLLKVDELPANPWLN